MARLVKGLAANLDDLEGAATPSAPESCALASIGGLWHTQAQTHTR